MKEELKDKLKKILTDIIDYQMNYVQLARTTEPYKFAKMGLKLLAECDVNKSDSLKCNKCGADETKQSCLGKWESGEEYRCDVCGNEWDYNH